MHHTIAALLINIVFAAVIVAAGFWIAKSLKNWISHLLQKRAVDPMLASFLSSILHVLMLAFVVIAALAKLGIQTTSLVAVFGAAGLAVGLALKDSLSNFAAGVMLIFFHPYRVGDYVEAAGTAGTVEGMQIFYTQFRTPDNRSVIVPNSKINGDIITNYSAKDLRRVDLQFGVAYHDDIRKVKSVLQSILDADERVLKDPAPVIALSELGDSSLKFIVRPWVRKEHYWDVYWSILEVAKLRFDEEDLTFPFPQHDVHLHQAA